MNTRITATVEETKQLAKEFTKGLTGGEIIFLNGELGAGKTTFAAEVGSALTVKENVTSPTFQLAKHYTSGHLDLLHIDAYRLVTAGITGHELLNQLEVTGLDDITENTVCLIEWGDSLKAEYVPRWEVNFTILDSTEARQIEVIEVVATD